MVRRNAGADVFLSPTSKNVEIYRNTVEGQFQGHPYFRRARGAKVRGTFDRRTVPPRQQVVVASVRGMYANGFAYLSCTSTQWRRI